MRFFDKLCSLRMTYCSLSHSILHTICGIKPIKPGFKEFSFTPNLSGLKRVKTEIPTPYGKIFVEIDTEHGINKINYPKECKLIK